MLQSVFACLGSAASLFFPFARLLRRDTFRNREGLKTFPYS
jgi:hypothetical protein